MKTCKHCGVEKDLEEFSKHAGFKDGRNSKCKDCKAEQQRDYYAANRDSSSYRKRMSKDTRKSDLKKKFKMTLTEYDEKLEEQQGLCAICGKEETANRNLAVDHDHSCCAGTYSCGKCVRGLLCTSCNLALGLLKDDINSVYKVIDYLEKWTD